MNTILTRSALAPVLVLPLAFALAGANQALAGGLWLNEFGDFSGGRAAAGNAAGTGDAAAIIYNPAGASGVQSGELFVAGGALVPSTEFDIESVSPLLQPTNDGGSAGVTAPGLALSYVNDFGLDQWDFGISVGALAGAGLDYNDEWVGRYQATEVTLLLMAVGTSIAWQPTDKLTLGIQPQLYYADLELDVNLPNLQNPILGADSRAELDGDDTGFGFLAGATYAFTDQTRIGISYQSELDIEFGGELKVVSGSDEGLGLLSDTDTELTMAAKVRASLQHDFSNRLTYHFSVGWDEWSSLDNVFVNIDTTGGGAGLEKNWDDTYHYAAGFEYKVNKNWDMTMGASYDSNPVDKEDRTADLPVDRQVRVAVGTRYHQSDNLVFGGYVNYADLGDAEIEAPGFSGDYDGENSLLGISLFMNWQL